MVIIWLMMVNNNQLGGWPTPLKNDGVRQWEGLYIPYMKWKKHVPNQQPDILLFQLLTNRLTIINHY